jgi:hypothetical protein
MPEMLQQELAVAKSLGVSPTKVTDAGFGKIAEQGPVKCFGARSDICTFITSL